MTDLRQRAERIAKDYIHKDVCSVVLLGIECDCGVIQAMLEMAAEVRREAIEECAQVADRYRAPVVGEAIRALLPAAQKEETA